MQADPAEPPADAGPASPTRDQLPENCVAYWLLVIADERSNRLDARQTRQQLETVRKAAAQLCQSLTRDYIWQRDDFHVQLETAGDLLYLHGVTDFGDAVEDEWLIVYILRELTKAHANLWVRVADSDGEFLLIEAANALPSWLSPEIDRCRVWIHNGNLRIIPVEEKGKRGLSDHHESSIISLPQAVEFLKSKSKALMDSGPIQSEAFYRLNKYPEHITTSMHHSLVTIPRKLAYILHSLPKVVAPAIECFYLRDAFALKPVLSASGPFTFPPTDLVTVSVRFSRVLFAQLRSQRFEAPPVWKSAFDTTPSKQHDALDIGMKLTSGFEMLAAKAEQSKWRVVREMAILLSDLEEDGEETLPSDQEMESWDGIHRNDDEAWLDINYEDFEKELEGKGRKDRQGSGYGFGDTQTQENLRKIVSRFEAFLKDDDAGLDGAELDSDESGSDDGSDGSESGDVEVDFDEDAFAGLLRQMMMGRSRSIPSQEEAEGRSKADGQDEDRDIQELSSQMEAELKELGALKLDSGPAKRHAAIKSTAAKDADEATQQRKGKERKEEEEEEEDHDEEGSEDEIDIDYNLAKNLLESFKSQGGMAGPAGNLMGLMGFQLPRDEDDGKDV